MTTVLPLIRAEGANDGQAKILVLGVPAASQIQTAAAGLGAEVWAVENLDQLGRCAGESSWGCLVADPLALNEEDNARISTFVKDWPGFPLVVWSPSLERRSAIQLLREGALDALHSPEDEARLRTALSEATRIGGDRHHHWRECREVTKRFEELNTKERMVLALLLRGRTNKEIALEFEFSLRTVEARRQRILRTMQAENAIDLAVLLCRRGLIDEALQPPADPPSASHQSASA